MIGTAFSPYYALGRKIGRAKALDYVTMNVALYSRSRSRWCMTERAGADRDAQRLAIGTSSIRWEGDSIVAELDEKTSPFNGRIKGRVVLHPEILHGQPYALDAAGSHLWWPIAPLARGEVVLEEPRLRFTGNAYFDANAGDGPLENDFSSWDWCRAPSREGAAVLYDVQRRDGTRRLVNVAFDAQGRTRQRADLVSHRLPGTRWGLERRVLGERTRTPQLLNSLEDTPFYSRSQVMLDVDGTPQIAVHEGLDLDRFRAPWVQCLLPMKMRKTWA